MSKAAWSREEKEKKLPTEEERKILWEHQYSCLTVAKIPMRKLIQFSVPLLSDSMELMRIPGQATPANVTPLLWVPQSTLLFLEYLILKIEKLSR